MEAPALMEAQTVPTSARYIDKLTTVGTCFASRENEATRTYWPLSLSLPLFHRAFQYYSMANQNLPPSCTMGNEFLLGYTLGTINVHSIHIPTHGVEDTRVQHEVAGGWDENCKKWAFLENRNI